MKGIELFCLAILVGLVFAWPVSNARAGCGLTSCPIEKHRMEQLDKRFGWFSASTLYGRFTPESTDAAYWVETLQGEWMPTHSLRASLRLPFAFVSVDGGDERGISDLVAEASWAPLHWNRGRSMLWLGSQLEFPTGDEEKHLGSGHFGVLPYASLHHSISPVVLYVQAGSRINLEGEHSHSVPAGDHTADHDGEHDHSDETHSETSESVSISGSLLDPHEDREFVFRSGVSTFFLNRWVANIALSGQAPWTGPTAGDVFLSVLPELRYQMGGDWSLQVHGELPVTENRRFEWRVGGGASYLF